MVATAVAIAITVASTAYQYQQAAKAKRKAKDAADARKGFEVVVEGEMVALPIAYGRNKIGGARVYHNVSTEYNDVASNANQSFEAGTSPLSGSDREALYFQQALAYGGISSVRDILINDDMRLDDERLTQGNSGYRIDVHWSGSVVDNMIRVNCPGRSNAKFSEVAYASCMFDLDRDDPQFQGVPDVAFLVEGRSIRRSANGELQYPPVYTNNPAWVLLDYLLVFRELDLEDIDLASFEKSAAVCDKIVMQNAAVGGAFWEPINGTKQTKRDIPLYECNILLDTSRSFRENVENILNTMGDSRLVWSQGKYKLVLQYPGINNANIEIAGVLTDEDLVLGGAVTVHYPEADQRFNKALVKFSDEAINFKQSSISWPRNTTDVSSFEIPTGSLFYENSRKDWNNRGSGRLLRRAGVTHDSNKFLWVFKPDVSGTYTGEFYAFSGFIEIGLKSNYSINAEERGLTESQSGSALMIVAKPSKTVSYDTGGRNGQIEERQARYDELDPAVLSVNLIAGQEYVILISGDRPAATLTGPNGSFAWYTRSESITGFIVRDYSNDIAVYEEMRAEDNGIALETETFLDGATSQYHALAKAEEMVRTSRSASEFEFEIILTDRYYEPGDIVELSSESLSIDGPLYIKIDKVKPAENGTCSLSGTRFDWTQLAWNVEDDQYLSPSPVFSQEFSAPSFLQYVPNLYDTKDSVGSLVWLNSGSTLLLENWIFIHVPGELNDFGELLFKRIGAILDPPFSLTALVHPEVIFGIQSVSKSGAVSEMITTSLISLDPAEPPTPENVSVAISGDRKQLVTVSWSIPELRPWDSTKYNNHYATEIYRGRTDVFEDAARLVTTIDREKFAEVPTEFGMLFYWVRFVSYSGVFGDFSESVSVDYDYYATINDITFEPPPPLNLAARPIIESIILTWDIPIYSEAGGHSATLIFAAPWLDGETEPTIIDATLIAKVLATRIYAHSISPNTRWVYWAKEVSVGGGVSAAYAGPVVAVTDQSAAIILEELEDKIKDQHLDLRLSERIDKIDAPDTGLLDQFAGLEATYGSTMNAAESAAAALDSKNQSLIYRNESSESYTLADGAAERAQISAGVAATSSDNAGNSATAASGSASTAVTAATSAGTYASAAETASTLAEGASGNAQTYAGQASTFAEDAQGSATAAAIDFTDLSTEIGKQTAAIQTQTQSINGIEASWSIRTDVNGRVSGVGLINKEGSPSLFEVMADNFAIYHPSASQSLVFGVSEGMTTMSGAYIVDATIDNAKITNLDAEKLFVANGDFVNLFVGNGEITNAKIGNTIQSNSWEIPGAAGWKLDKNGSATFRGQNSVSGLGGFAFKDSLFYSEVTGSKPPTNADNTGSNTAYDTANVSGSSASTIRNAALAGQAAKNRTDTWVRPSTTFIDGNKIFTGDAYVDTLQIQGNAVTIPVFGTAPRNDTIIAPNTFRNQITSVSAFFPGSVSTVFTITISANAPNNDTNVLFEIRDENNGLVGLGESSTRGGRWTTQHVFSFQGLMGSGNRTFYLNVGCSQPFNNNSGWSVMGASLLILGVQR